MSALPAFDDRASVLRSTAVAFHETDEAWWLALQRQFGRRACDARYSSEGRGADGSELRRLYVARYAAFAAWCEARNMPAIPDPVASAVTVACITAHA